MRRDNSLTRRRGQSVEMEVDYIVISATHTILYKNFHDVALQSIFVRYSTEELASLQEIEEELCTPGATASVSNIFERYKADLSDDLTKDIFSYQI